MLIMNLQNSEQENDVLSMIRIIQFIVKEMRMVQLLNLKLKSLYQVVIICDL